MSIESVLTVMGQLIEIHDVLLELGAEKKEVLVAGDVNRLNQIVLKESKLVKQIEALEKQRVMDVSSFLLSRGYYPNPQITVSDLIKVVFKNEDKQQLQALQRELVAKLQELQKLNELNQQLIKQSLSYIDYSLDLVTGDESEDLFYKNPAQQRNSFKRNGYFDTRA